jgi:hypothetical protein
LNSNEFLEESTATSSSVMLSGARRVKEMPGLDIGDYSTDSPNSDRGHDEPHFQLRPKWAGDLSERDMLAELRSRKELGKGAYA